MLIKIILSCLTSRFAAWRLGFALWMFSDVSLGCLEPSFPLHYLKSCFHLDGVRIQLYCWDCPVSS